MQTSPKESQIQAAVVTYLRAVLRGLLLHPANGGFRNKLEAAKFQRMGVLPGIHDLIFLGPGGHAHLLEIKTATGRLSEDQKVIHKKCDDLDIPHAVIRDLDEVRRYIIDNKLPLKF